MLPNDVESTVPSCAATAKLSKQSRMSRRDDPLNKQSRSSRHDDLLDCKVYVGNLPENASFEELKNRFYRFGRIRNLWIARRPHGFAFVEFEDSCDARNAIKMLDGTLMCGVRARVELSCQNLRPSRAFNSGYECQAENRNRSQQFAHDSNIPLDKQNIPLCRYIQQRTEPIDDRHNFHRGDHSRQNDQLTRERQNFLCSRAFDGDCGRQVQTKYQSWQFEQGKQDHPLSRGTEQRIQPIDDRVSFHHGDHIRQNEQPSLVHRNNGNREQMWFNEHGRMYKEKEFQGGQGYEDRYRASDEAAAGSNSVGETRVSDTRDTCKGGFFSETPVNKWLLCVRAESTQANKLKELVNVTVGVGPSGKKLICEKIEQLKKEVHPDCMLDISRKRDHYNRLSILMPKGLEKKLDAYIAKEITPLVERLSRKTRDLAVSGTTYKVHIGPGALPIELIFPGDFCSLFVGCAPADWDQLDQKFLGIFEDQFYMFGATDVVRFGPSSQKKTGYMSIVRMASRKAAAQVIKILQRKSGMNLGFEARRHDVGSTEPAIMRLQLYELRLTWWRRPSRRVLKFKLQAKGKESRNTAILLLQGLGFNTIEEAVDRDLGNEFDFTLVARGVDENLTATDVSEKVENALSEHGICIREIFVVRRKAYCQESNACRKRFADRIAKYVKQAMRTRHLLPKRAGGTSFVIEEDPDISKLPFIIEVPPVRCTTDLTMHASIIFDTYKDYVAITNALQEEMTRSVPLSMGHRDNMHTVKMKKVIRLACKLRPALYAAVECNLPPLKIRLEQLEEPVRLGHKELHNGRHMVYVEGNNYEKLLEAKESLKKMISGKIYDCVMKDDKAALPYYFLLTRKGQNFLDTIESKASGALVIRRHFFKQQVQVQGGQASIEEADRTIRSYLSKVKRPGWKYIIPVVSPQYTNGTLTAFTDTVGRDSKSLLLSTGVYIPMEADYARSELSIIGTSRDQQEVVDMLTAISKELENDDISRLRSDRSPPQCVICLNRVDQNWFCFETCGHYACKACVAHQVESQLTQRIFPLECVQCAKPIALKDIEEVIVDGWQEEETSFFVEQLQPLAKAAVAYFMTRNLDKYRYCWTPDCPVIHRLTEEVGLDDCPFCSRVFCTHCGRDAHPTLSCEDYERLRGDVDTSLQHWMDQDPENRQVCPNPVCRAVIEKARGCNHMQCCYCKTDFCWICFMMAPSSGDIYEHLNDIHGGNGANINDIDLDDLDEDMREALRWQLEFERREEERRVREEQAHVAQEQVDETFDQFFRIVSGEYVPVRAEDFDSSDEDELNEEAENTAYRTPRARTFEVLPEDFNFRRRFQHRNPLFY